jgi:hypothetical protein
MVHGRPMLRREGNNGQGSHRVARWCLLTCLRDVRRSLRTSSAISLPNLLRLCRRRWFDAAWCGASGSTFPDEQLRWLAGFYLMEQPFERTNWARCRREAGAG